MTRRLVYAAAALALAAGIAWAWSAHRQAVHRDNAQAQAVEAARLGGEGATKGEEAQAHRDQANQIKEQAAVAEASKQRADAHAATAKREAAALRAGLTKPPFSSATVKDSLTVDQKQPAAGGGAIPAALSEGVPQLQAMIEKDEEVIAAQDEQIRTRDVLLETKDRQIGALTAALDASEASAAAFAKQARAQAAVAEEWRKASTGHWTAGATYRPAQLGEVGSFGGFVSYEAGRGVAIVTADRHGVTVGAGFKFGRR